MCQTARFDVMRASDSVTYGEEMVALSQKQWQGIKVVENVTEGRLTMAQRAERPRVSSRAVKRLLCWEAT